MALDPNGPALGWKRQEIVVDMPDHWTWSDVQQAIIAKLNRDEGRKQADMADHSPFGLGTE